MKLESKKENIVFIKDNYFYSDLNLNNILEHIKKVQNFNGSKSLEYFGSYGTQQRGSFRIVKSYENFYINAMLETKQDYFEKLEICEEPHKAISLYIDFLSKYQLDYIKYLETSEEEILERQQKKYIYNLIENNKHIGKILPFIEDNKIEYYINIDNYIEVYYIDKDNYNFNAVIEAHQFIKKNIDTLELETLIESIFSIMKNYKKYKIIDHDFIKYGIDIFTCIDVSMIDIKDIIKKENIKDITIEDNLITMHKDNKVLAKINIKNEIPFNKFTKEDQDILLKYYYDKLEENNIKYDFIY